jgi:hypothetical protein
MTFPDATYAAWVRTGLMLAAGVGAKKTLGAVLPEWVVLLTGSVLVAFAAFCFAAAVWRELYPGTPPPRSDVWQAKRRWGMRETPPATVPRIRRPTSAPRRRLRAGG